jgi:hypothetical protein
MPTHTRVGKTNYNAKANNECKYESLMRHFMYLLNLGEVLRAMRIVTTLVNGMQGHTNREVTVGMNYLPISMGDSFCYKRYMASLGYNVRTSATGAVIVEGDERKAVDPDEFVSFPT